MVDPRHLDNNSRETEHNYVDRSSKRLLVIDFSCWKG